ncbi:MAG: metalloregulator ArsR/SmtB family transcription factor [Chloroflexi bacterium]|nr:metalloregulator ArsR/SmtB family transcription factor [Chloroflexota bacterium]
MRGTDAAHGAATVGTRVAKDDLHEAFAQVGKALANPHRIELLELVAQGERSVEALAARADISVALASAHLQVLRRGGLVTSRRVGTRVLYVLAHDDAYALLAALQAVASRLGTTEQAAARYLGAPVEAVGREELVARVRAGDAVVVDLRPAEEFAAGHIAGAVSIPLSELETRLAELPTDVEIVAYCRGPYCAMSPQGVALLRRLGRRARRLEDGYPEWRLAGLPVETGGGPG